jgi:hypothetical protein
VRHPGGINAVGAREDDEAGGEAAVRDGNAGKCRCGDGGGDTGHHFELDAGVDERQGLLAAAAQHKRVAALEPHHAEAGRCRVDQLTRDGPLRRVFAATAFADGDPIRARRQRTQLR